MTLVGSEVIYLDAQTTGASPAHGHLMELAWARGAASVEGGCTAAVEASLLSLPEGAAVPPRVSKLTGITDADLEGAPGPVEAYERFLSALEGMDPPLVVIHYARFEMAFLRDLEALRPSGASMEVVCTHEIARRLLPDLPRRGIRALAGHLGHPVGSLKRAGDNVVATALIWARLCEMLARRGVQTLAQLRVWLTETRPAKKKPGPYTFALSRQRRLSLPASPGVYRMLDRHKQVLYVGKATSLKGRVNSYFQKRRGHTGKTLELLTCVHDLDFTKTDTALEAALLESDEIKRHDPPFNIALKAGRGPLSFAEPDLQHVGPASRRAGLLGPVPAPEPLLSMAALLRLLREGEEVGDFEVALRVGRDTCLEEVPLRQGLELFVRAHGINPGSSHLLRDLWRLGARRIWASRSAASAKQDQAEEPEASREPKAQDETEEEAAWTAERVQAACESAVVRASRMVNRGRWLCRLSESRLVWTPGRRGSRRVLTVSRGAVVEASSVAVWAPQDSAQFVSRPVGSRWKCFDPIVYDRLRVLSTELKRLVVEDSGVLLYTGYGPPMDAAAVSRQLIWI